MQPQQVRWRPHSDLPPEEREVHLKEYGLLDRWARDVPCQIGTVTGVVDFYVWQDEHTFQNTHARFDVEIGDFSFTVEESAEDGKSYFPNSLAIPVDVYGLFKALANNGHSETLKVVDLTREQMQTLFQRPVPGFTEIT